jgi:hypothetical protein
VNERAKTGTLVHVHAAVDVKNLAGNVASFVARKEDDRCGDFVVCAESAERDQRFHFFLQLGRERIGHRRFDEAGRDGIDGDAARSDFDGDGARETDQAFEAT